MKKTLIGLLMTTVMLMALAAPLIAIPSVKADSSDYKTVSGVLGSDYYTLYPYEQKSLKIGFSKWGELINSEDNVGLEYNSAIDPFAYPSGSAISSDVPKRMWVQGWFMNITYEHRTLGERWVWAGAMHSDSIVYGGNWIRVDLTNDRTPTYGLEDFRDPGYYIGAANYGTTLVQGGRKTNGTTVTDPIEVLYDGPREFIAVCRTTLYDHLVYGSDSNESDVPLVQIAFTIRFDKVKKTVVEYKDVKSLLVEKEGIKMKIQFSNRGEVDLGTSGSISSYAHFWTQGTTGVESVDNKVEGQPTVYDSSYELIQTENPKDTEYPGFSAAGPYPQASAATYDYAQAVNPTAGYAWSGAFWPSLSDWSIDGWDQWWHSLTANDPHYIDYRDDEPFIPFYISEWDFVLYHVGDSGLRTQFRGVAQYAVTVLHDGDDANEPFTIGYKVHSNAIDSEMMYYLNETFTPWSLNQAVEKDTTRHVEWCVNATSFTTTYAPVVQVSDKKWNDYDVFSERVLQDNKTLLQRGTGYTVSYSATTGKMTITFRSATSAKILYSTHDGWSGAGVTTLDPISYSANFTSENVTAGDVVDIPIDDTYTSAADPLGVVNSWSVDATVAYTVSSVTGDWNTSIEEPSLDDVKSNFWVDFENYFAQGFYYWNNIDYTSGAVSASVLPLSNMYLTISCASTVNDVFISHMDMRMYLEAFISYNATEQELNITVTPTMYFFVLDENRMGRYEWAEVGRDAATVDSAGAALVSEALDSYKHIGVGIAGADMDNSLSANQMPYVMAQFGAGTSVADYKDSLFRAALKDDFCTKWPVASSNMFAIGGPLANVLSYYVNDFTDAFYGTPAFSGTAYSGSIAAISCLDRNWQNTTGYNTYKDYSMMGYYMGYAVISTYKDINGTVIFDVWGMEGRDTYYASLWLHGDAERGFTPGIVEMQSFPDGVTSMVLGIMYGNDWKHPVYVIPELLGTISETKMSAMYETDGLAWYYSMYGSAFASYAWKGGLHDP